MKFPFFCPPPSDHAENKTKDYLFESAVIVQKEVIDNDNETASKLEKVSIEYEPFSSTPNVKSVESSSQRARH